MRDRASWLNATMIELADTGYGDYDESVYLGNFSERLAELLGPAEVCLLLPAEPASPASPARISSPGRVGRVGGVGTDGRVGAGGSARIGTGGAVRPGGDGAGGTVRPGGDGVGGTVRPGGNGVGGTARPDEGASPARTARPARSARAGAAARTDGLRAIAIGSGELAAGFSRLEADGVPGPCVSCYRTGQPIRHLPLAEARSRWPVFTAMAGAAGLKTCTALPMRRHRETIGAVSVLTASGREAPPSDFGLARALTEMATIGVLRLRELHQAQRLARQLQCALDSRIVIEQAKGAVSAWLGVTPGDAFGLLRSYARARSRPLPQVAGEVLIGTVPVATLQR